MNTDSHQKWNVADISITFNKHIRKCLTLISTASKNSTSSQALLDTARRRIKLVSEADPLFLIENVGRYLFQYRDIIHSDLDNFILNPEKYISSEHKLEIETVKNSGEVKKDEVSAMDNLLELLKNQWKAYSPSEKKIVKTSIQTLLAEYCKYLVVKERSLQK